MSELQIQTKVFQYFWNNFPETRYMLFHVPNGGKRNIREAMSLKSSGVIAGISDFIFIWNKRVYGIEIKIEKGVLSSEQKKVHHVWRSNGINTYICYGYDQTIKAITDIIYGRDLETRTN